jgi:hypothetical protein
MGIRVAIYFVLPGLLSMLFALAWAGPVIFKPLLEIVHFLFRPAVLILMVAKYLDFIGWGVALYSSLILFTCFLL